jgi:hypothetical protein
MANPFLTSHQPDADRQSLSDEPHPGDGGEQLPHEQLDRLAELVAIGEGTLAPELSPVDRQRVERRVRHLRRVRLVQFFARQIALDIHRERRGGIGESP